MVRERVCVCVCVCGWECGEGLLRVCEISQWTEDYGPLWTPYGPPMAPYGLPMAPSLWDPNAEKGVGALAPRPTRRGGVANSCSRSSSSSNRNSSTCNTFGSSSSNMQ